MHIEYLSRRSHVQESYNNNINTAFIIHTFILYSLYVGFNARTIYICMLYIYGIYELYIHRRKADRNDHLFVRY